MLGRCIPGCCLEDVPIGQVDETVHTLAITIGDELCIPTSHLERNGLTIEGREVLRTIGVDHILHEVDELVESELRVVFHGSILSFYRVNLHRKASTARPGTFRCTRR